MDAVYYSQVGISFYKNIVNIISYTVPASHKPVQNLYMECASQLLGFHLTTVSFATLTLFHTASQRS